MRAHESGESWRSCRRSAARQSDAQNGFEEHWDSLLPVSVEPRSEERPLSRCARVGRSRQNGRRLLMQGWTSGGQAPLPDLFYSPFQNIPNLFYFSLSTYFKQSSPRIEQVR